VDAVLGDAVMGEVKMLIIHPEKCNNCGDCETACIKTRASLTSLGLFCIRILKDIEDEDFFSPSPANNVKIRPAWPPVPKRRFIVMMN